MIYVKINILIKEFNICIIKHRHKAFNPFDTISTYYNICIEWRNTLINTFDDYWERVRNKDTIELFKKTIFFKLKKFRKR